LAGTIGRVRPAHYERRLVSRNAGIRWNRNWVNVSHVLGGEPVELEAIDDGLWDCTLGPSGWDAFTNGT
jgi:hypothetical protein